MWLALLAILFTVNMEAQMTIGGKKEPEAFSVLELLNKGGLRLPQMTTAQRNDFAVKGKVAGEGLTIYNIDTKCVEYWNATRWVSLCEGTSQTKISPTPCVNVAADGTGCDQTFTVDDVDCPNGPFNIAIVAGGEYASLSDVDNTNGKFKINFFSNETVNIHTVLVRVTSTCTSLFKEFLFSQNGVDCTSMSYTVPSISPSSTALTLCTGGAVYLSVPATTANLDKLIWTRNGAEIPGTRGTSYIIATQKGEYNISMGAVGCNTSDSNKRTITESGSVTPVTLSALASNNGVICGTGKVTLSVSGNGSTSVVWFHNGKEEKTGDSIDISGDSSVGEWFAATKDGTCYSKPSNSIQITKSETASTQLSLPATDVLVNGVQLSAFTAFCAGGSLDLNITNKISGVTYTWYNGNDVITTNPYIVPTSQTTMSLRVVATDNSGAKCPAEQNKLEAAVTQGSTPAKPTVTSVSTLCNGAATLTISESGTYIWYKNGAVLTGETGKELNINSEGTYGAAIKNATGCISPMTEVKISGNSSEPNVSWDPNVNRPATATFGSSVTLTVNDSYNSTFSWTLDGVKLSYTGKTATIALPTSGTPSQIAKIAVTAKNECGEKTITHEITMNSACPTPVINSISASAQTIIAKTNVTINISTKDINTPTYQWFQNTTDSTTGGTPVGTGVSYSTNQLTTGTYYFYCTVTNGCNGTPSATSLTTKVTVNDSPADMQPGGGTLSGKTCFDVVQINNGTDCGTLVSRASQKANFANTYTYTFTPSGTITDFHFDYIENVGVGKIVESFTDNGNYTVTVKYKTALSGPQPEGAAGLNAANAYSVSIYAVFKDGTGAQKSVKLTAQIKDCMCCGAMVSATEWRAFMCHNLGVDQTLDPFTPTTSLFGTYYTYANIANAYVNGKKSTVPGADPCPDGYRVPLHAEWVGVVASNTPTLNANGPGGVMIGDNLMLPMAGYKISNSPYLNNMRYRGFGLSGSAESIIYTVGKDTGLKTAFMVLGATAPIRCIAIPDNER
ncbi:hypothetical protein DBB36_00035 [Flavobacterium sp. WLB]|nr:hypothetical protein AKO67_15030 [Flavobacterium sp. VMW]OWU88448.1 hypothetical protein APR43_23160 [Flavobacterium sp. NLM]PUU72007.1 hypothetical protein DBB36_00035 [Flavobacterium sp. WLB]